MRRKRTAYRRRRRNNPDYSKHPIVRQIVGRLHVGASDAEVEELMRSKLTGKATEAQRRAIVHGAIKAHKRNREEYRWVMSGGHGYKGRKAKTNPYGPKSPSELALWLNSKHYYEDDQGFIGVPYLGRIAWYKPTVAGYSASGESDTAGRASLHKVERRPAKNNPVFRGSFDKAKRQAQANADHFVEPFVLFRDSSGNLRVERQATAGHVARRDGLVFRPNVSDIRRAAVGYGHLGRNPRRRAYRDNALVPSWYVQYYIGINRHTTGRFADNLEAQDEAKKLKAQGYAHVTVESSLLPPNFKSMWKRPARQRQQKKARHYPMSSGWNPRRRYAIKEKGGSRWYGNVISSGGILEGWANSGLRNEYENKAYATRVARKIGGEVYEVFPYFPPMKAFKRSRRNPRRKRPHEMTGTDIKELRSRVGRPLDKAGYSEWQFRRQAIMDAAGNMAALAGTMHRNSVSQALRGGKRVHRVVLMDYPELRNIKKGSRR